MSSWADKVRQQRNPVELVNGGDETFAAMQRVNSTPLLNAADDGDDTEDSRTPGSSTHPTAHRPRPRSTLARIDVGAWIEVLSYLSYRDICSLGLTCRGLWSVHLLDMVWYWQECFLRRDLWLARGQPNQAACVQDEVSPVQQRGSAPAARYRQFKALKVLAARDLRREWDFRELVSRRYAGTRMQIQMENNPDLQLHCGVLTRSLTLIGTGRILKSDLRIFDVGRQGPLRPSQLLGICDELRANVDGNISVLDTTEQQEDQKLVMHLLVGLSARQAGPNLLHVLGPRISLIEITREEATAFTEHELASRRSEYSNLMDDFVIDSASTRYFVGPELCNGHRVGIVMIDSLRLLLVTNVERGELY